MMAFEMFSDTNEQTKDKFDLILLSKIIDKYNKSMCKYTRSFKGQISKPVDISKIPIEYGNISNYLNSKPAWKQILKFIKESKIDDISDYIDVMIRNWNSIKYDMHCSQLNRPTSKIIFSLKMLNFYYTYKTKELNADKFNGKIVTESAVGFNDLNPDFKTTDKNSLNRLKNLNPDLSYKQIVTIFRGEFSQSLLDKIDKCGYNILEDLLK